MELRLYVVPKKRHGSLRDNFTTLKEFLLLNFLGSSTVRLPAHGRSGAKGKHLWSDGRKISEQAELETASRFSVRIAVARIFSEEVK